RLAGEQRLPSIHPSLPATTPAALSAAIHGVDDYRLASAAQCICVSRHDIETIDLNATGRRAAVPSGAEIGQQQDVAHRHGDQRRHGNEIGHERYPGKHHSYRWMEIGVNTKLSLARSRLTPC